MPAGESSFDFSFSGGTHGNTSTAYRQGPAQRAPFATEDTRTPEHVPPFQPSASMSLAGWHASPGHAPAALRTHPAHSMQAARQPSVADERASMGMHSPQHRPQAHPVTGYGHLNHAVQYKHECKGSHTVHTYNPLALDSTTNSFTSVQGDMKAMRQPAPTGFVGFQAHPTANSNPGVATAGADMHAHVPSGEYTSEKSEAVNFNRQLMPGVQQHHAQLPGSSTILRTSLQQPAVQQLQWSNRFPATLQSPAGGVHAQPALPISARRRSIPV